MMNTWFQGVRGGITVDFNYVGNFLMHANHVLSCANCNYEHLTAFCCRDYVLGIIIGIS